MALTISHGTRSEGGRRRPRNEDRYCAEPGLGLFVVCDGMGGVNAGEIASTLAVQTIHRHFVDAVQNPNLRLVGKQDNEVSLPTNRLASAIRQANDVIYKRSSTCPAWYGMGSTVIASVITDNMLSYAHVGDSRLYLVRNQTIQLLTTDHSWVAEQVQQGILTEHEAEQSSHSHIITRALGAEPTVSVTLGELPLFQDDLVLLCSDGLTKDVPSSMILDALLDTGDAQTFSNHLVTMANDAGGEDDKTVIVLVMRQEPKHGFWGRLHRRLAL